MYLNDDICSALQVLEDIKQTVDDLNDPNLQANTYMDLSLLISVLDNPVFRGIVTVQDSLNELNLQLDQHPSILPVDFDITASGQLVLNVLPTGDLFDFEFAGDYQTVRDFDKQRVPISPGSPHILHFNSSDSKMLILDNKTLNGNICNQEALRF